MKKYIQVFKFEELSEKAKKTAINNSAEFIGMNLSDSISDSLNNYYKGILEENGFEKIEIETDSYNNVNIYYDGYNDSLLNEKVLKINSEIFEKINEYGIDGYKSKDCGIVVQFGLQEYFDFDCEKLEKESEMKIGEFIKKLECEINQYINNEEEYYFSNDYASEYFCDEHFTKEGIKV